MGQALPAGAARHSPLAVSGERPASSAGGRASPWLKPWAVAAAIGIAAAIGVLNFAAALVGDREPWLAALDLFADLAVLATGIVAVIVVAMRSDARALRMQSMIDDVQARLSAIVDSAMDAIVIVDDTQRIVLFNRAAEQMFGCPRGEALGTALDRFIPERYRERHRRHIGAFSHTGETTRRMGDILTLWGLRADGREFPIEASISRTHSGGRGYYTAIVHDVTMRKEFEDALQRQQLELHELSARVLEAREEEKTLIARELHDELGQLLTALKMDLSWLRGRLPDPLAAKASQMNALLDQTVASVRRISADLRPLMLDDLGLVDAVQWLVEDFGRRSGIECRLDLDDAAGFESVERDAATALYRALQESLTNIARHSGARKAWVVLGRSDDVIELEIMDDGRGISTEDVTKARSLGLKGMRERIHHLHGTLEVGRAERGGTRIRACVPVRAAATEPNA